MAEPVVLVHVWKGRNNHLGNPKDYHRRTLCGKPWLATVFGPPSSDRPTCKDCSRQLDSVSIRTGCND